LRVARLASSAVKTTAVEQTVLPTVAGAPTATVDTEVGVALASAVAFVEPEVFTAVTIK
jgi:hypothetical protein